MIGLCRNAFQPVINHPTAEKGCVSEHIIFRGGSLVVSRWRGGPGWLEVWWVCELLIQLNAPLCCHGCTAVPDCTVLCQGGPSPHLPASNTTGDQRVGPTEELGGGGAFTLESQQHFQRVRPDLGTRASKRGHCTPCATPRACTSCSCSTKRIHKRRLQHLGTNFKSSNKNAPPQSVRHFYL